MCGPRGYTGSLLDFGRGVGRQSGVDRYVVRALQEQRYCLPS